MVQRVRASALPILSNVPNISIQGIPGIPLIKPYDDLTTIVLDAATQAGITLQQGDVLVISSKVVSKAEDRLVDLRTIQPSEQALQVAQETGKDPRLVELVLQQSIEISRKAFGVLVTRHRLGFVSANAGIDQSNIGANSEDFALLLPDNPDHSAALIRDRLCELAGVDLAIIISDSHGRPFRIGNVGVALGVCGMPALIDLRGQQDLFGRELQISIQGYADLAASAAHLACGEGDEGFPVILVRGLRFAEPYGTARDLNRPIDKDLYR